MRGRNLEDDRGLFERKGCLGRELVREGIVPREGDSDLSESKFQEFELTKVLVKQVSCCYRSVMHS